MEYKTKSIASRIEWCLRQKTQACAELEREGWQAEEEGLRDALLNRNHTNQYQHCPPGVFGRYVLGLQDGQALIRATAMANICQPTPVGHMCDTGSIQESYRGRAVLHPHLVVCPFGR